MALDGDVLGAAILAAVNAVPQPPTDRSALFRAIAHAIVDHIKANAVVSGTTASACTAGGSTGTCVATIT
jgi:hypothetical protein